VRPVVTLAAGTLPDTAAGPRREAVR
jgi:hypothetical protein